MKYALLFMTALGLAACGNNVQKSPMFLGVLGPMEWPEEHWEGQNYHPLIRDEQNALPAATNQERSLFANVESLSAEQFIEHLKSARIVKRVYRTARKNRMKGENTPHTTTVVVMPNFYALSATDQNIIGNLIYRSYDSETYLVQDGISNLIVGQITESGLNLY